MFLVTIIVANTMTIPLRQILELVPLFVYRRFCGWYLHRLRNWYRSANQKEEQYKNGKYITPKRYELTNIFNIATEYADYEAIVQNA